MYFNFRTSLGPARLTLVPVPSGAGVKQVVTTPLSALSQVRSHVVMQHTPSIAFRHLPPDSATVGNYPVKGYFISAQLPTDAAVVEVYQQKTSLANSFRRTMA